MQYCNALLLKVTFSNTGQNAHHTLERRQRDEANHNMGTNRRPRWANLVRMLGLHPYSFSKDILGFLITTESQNLGLTSHLKDGAFCKYSIPITILRVRYALGPTQTAGLTNTSSRRSPIQ